MALFIAFLSFILSTTARDSGEYFPNYNQSYFGWSGSPKGYCTLTADYESGGRPYTNQAYSWQGCEKTELSYESQQAFDLTYWELLKVCPTLLKTPLSERGTVDWSKPAKGKGKYLLPDQLVWSTQCSSNDWTFNNDNQWDSNGLIAANMYCPRWKCDNSSALWDKDYNASFTYQEIIQLEFGSTPLKSSCWKCHCAYWPDGKDWVWTCDNSYANYPDGGNGGEAGKGWTEDTLNPIDNIFTYPTRKCMEATPGPTPQPSDGTPNPTPSPSVPPTNDNTCTSVWNAVNEQWKIRPGEYYWDTPATDDCSTISLCKCQDGGTGYCKSSYSDIMSDTELYPEFLKRCGSSGNGGYLSECWTPDKADQLFQYYDFAGAPPHASCTFSSDRFCPRCGCTTDPFTQSPRTNGTSNTTVYKQRINDTYEYICTECDCVFVPNSPRGAVSRMDCNGDYIYDFKNNNEQYPSDLSADCFYKDRRCYNNFGDYEADAPSVPCSDQRVNSSTFNNYCSFTRKTFEDSSADNVCVEDQAEIIGYWGCGASWRCDLLANKYESETGCYKADYTYKVAQYDCINDKWIGDNYKANMRYSCCNDAWNCNNRTIDEYLEDDCTKADELKEYNMFQDSCYYSQRNLYDLTDDESLIRAAFCGDRLDYYKFEEENTAEQDSTEAYCTLLKVYWQYHTFCSCNSKRLQIKYLESDPDPESAQIKDADLMIKYFKNDFWAGSDGYIYFKTLRNRLTIMYEYWGCIDYETDSTVTNADTFFTCDFDADIEKINNEAVSYGAANNIFSYWTYIIVLISFLFNTKHNRFLSIFLIGLFGMMYVNAAPDYDWDMYTNSRWNKCEFRGDVDTSNSDICEQITYEKSVFQNEDLTWDVLVESCPELKYAGCWTNDKQLDMDKLIWPNQDHQCAACPQCPCSNATDTIRHYVRDIYNLYPNNMIYQRCYRCVCDWNDNAEDYGFDCSKQGNDQHPPYTLNDTEFCPGTDAPTSAPTQPLTIECMEGSDFDNLLPIQDTMLGESGYSHCKWFNYTRERYPDAEPAVCVSDKLGPSNGWDLSENTEGLCQAIAGSGTGCYYTEYDQTLHEYDCARKKWISDKYRIAATVFCCNDGYYCNNQTMVQGGGDINEVQYYSFDNETETAKCKSSGKLKSFLQNKYCEYTNPDMDDGYIYKLKCAGGDTDSKPTCDDLTKYWKYYSRCECKRASWWRGNVNSTYKEYIEDKFERWADGVANDLIDWNETLNCGWKPNTKWYCSSANYHGTSIVAVIFIAVSYVFV